MSADTLKMPTWLIEALVKTAIAGTLALQIYLVKEVSSLEARVAALSARIEVISGARQLTLK